MDQIDKDLLNALQTSFPLDPKPFETLGKRLGISEDEVMARVRNLKKSDLLRQISAIFDSAALGYSSVLAALRVDPEELDRAAAIVSRHRGVSHNYSRNHDFNLWFTLTVPPGQSADAEADSLKKEAGAQALRLLPTVRLFKIGVSFDMSETGVASLPAARTERPGRMELSEDDVKAIRALQEDLPLESRPFERPAKRLGWSDDELLRRAREYLDSGLMRRFAATLRHRNAGFSANAMGVWVVPEERAEELGTIMSGFPAVSHCYQRPTYPDWPYSLFTMIHGRSKEECEGVARSISEATGITEYRLLYSAKEYKKIRVRYFEEDAR